MTKESAEMVAIQALSFIASEPDRCRRFLALTGLELQSLRAAAQEAGFLLGVLDHLAGDDSLLHQFAEQAAIDPARIAQARARLSHPAPQARG